LPQVADAAAERLASEEKAKELLCQELNLLVRHSTHEPFPERCRVLEHHGKPHTARMSGVDDAGLCLELCQVLLGVVQVQQSAHAQLQKLDALTRRLEALNAPSQSPEVQAQDM
jgi:hypothetical protein